MIDWRHWHNEPHLIGGLILLAWLYALATGPFRSRLAPGRPYPARAACLYYSSLVLFYLAVGSPFDQLGERFLFSAHMLQHEILIYPCPVLFLLGLPGWLVEPIVTRPFLRPIVRLLVHPVFAGFIFVAILSIWHYPGLYDWALQNRDVHIAEHLMFFATAILYWWPILSPSSVFPRLGTAGQMVYLNAVVIGMVPVFAYIAFANEILYPTYEFAPRLFSRLGPTEDQLLGAVIMKAGAMGVTLIVMFILFMRWYMTDRQSTRAN